MTISATVALVLRGGVLGYPLAYLIAKTKNVARNTLLMILVLAAMQLDMVIRLYGMMVLLGRSRRHQRGADLGRTHLLAAAP